MSWKGRIIGAIIGLLFSPLGAVIGFLIGYFAYDKKRNELLAQSQAARDTLLGNGGDPAAHEQIIASTFRLMGYVARGAGRVNESHIKQAENLMDAMHLDEHRRHIAIDAFNFGKSEEFDLNAEAVHLRQVVGTNLTLISYLLEIQVGIAIADEVLDQGEHERLLYIAQALGINVNDMERLIRIRIAEQQFARFSQRYAQQRQRQYEQQGHSGSYSEYGNHSYENYEKFGYDEDEAQSSGSSQGQAHVSRSELDRAYEILGVTPETPWDDVRRAHKKLMLKYHPDRLAAQGLPPEMVKLYTQKSQDIQAAFALIKESRGK